MPYWNNHLQRETFNKSKPLISSIQELNYFKITGCSNSESGRIYHNYGYIAVLTVLKIFLMLTALGHLFLLEWVSIGFCFLYISCMKR